MVAGSWDYGTVGIGTLRMDPTLLGGHSCGCELLPCFLSISLLALNACLHPGQGDASRGGEHPPASLRLGTAASPSPAQARAVITARGALIAPFQLIKPDGDPNYDPLSCRAPYF